MSRKNKQTDKKQKTRKQIVAHCNNLFPDCIVEWTGTKSRSALEGRTFGFQLKDKRTGKYRCNIVWVNPDYGGPIGEGWVQDAVRESNG
jgi:hypothetical protein